MRNNFFKKVTSKISTLLVTALTLALLTTSTAFADSTYGIRYSAPVNVGDEESLEVYYTVDTASQTWANGDTLTFTSPIGDWGDLDFDVEFDTDDENDGIGETALIAGGGNGQYAVAADVLTVQWDDTTWQTANGHTIRVIINDHIFLFADDYSFTYGGATASGGDVNPSSAVAITVSPGALSGTNVEPESLFISSKSPHTISFTTNVPIANLGKIVVTYPAGWSLTEVAGTTATNLSGLNGTWTATVVGQVLTLTQTGGTLSSAGIKSLNINGIYTPSTAGSGGAYGIATFTAEDTALERDLAVTADTIAIGNSSRNVTLGSVTEVLLTKDSAGHVSITWKDPSDASSAIAILRGKNGSPVNGVPYAKVDKGIQKFTDTDIKDGDKVSYILRAVDNNSNGGPLTETFTFVLSADSASTVISESTPTEEVTTTTEKTTPALSDINNHWAKEVIEKMVEKGIVKGNPDDTFKPDGNLNRAEAAAMFHRVLYGDATPTTPTVAPFSDVAVTEWYAGFVAKIKADGVVKGNPDGTYQPTESINRAEFVTIAIAAYETKAKHDLEAEEVDLERLLAQLNTYFNEETTSSFPDVKNNEWYSKNVSVAVKLELINGKDCSTGKCFDPSAPVTRAEAATIISRLLAHFSK